MEDEELDGRSKRLPFANCIVALILLSGTLIVVLALVLVYLARDSGVIR